MKQRYFYINSGAIGEATFGMHLGRVLAANVPGATLELVSTRPNAFVRELVADLPFITYRELSKDSFRSWLALPGLLFHSYKSAVLETVTVPLPIWWRILLWCTRQGSGTEVRYQMSGHERPVPHGVTALTYVCQDENLFDAPARILTAWGIEPNVLPIPSLPRKQSPIMRPYMVFHFFAGNYRRSIPVDHARAILIEARAKYPEHLFIVTCAGKEAGPAERMCDGITDVQIEKDKDAVSVVALLSGADVVVGTASGIIFIAAQLVVPTVAMSCLVDPCWLPAYSPSSVIVAAYTECRCNGDKTGVCVEDTPDGEVFRCLFFITTDEVLTSMDSIQKKSARRGIIAV